MRVLDLIASAAAIGIFGYFVYKVILPKLGDIELPSFQFTPPTGQIQQPPQQPVVDQLPPPAQPIGQDPESKTKKPQEEPEKPKSQAPLVPSRSPPVAVSQPTTGGTLLWDSNTHGKWNSGKRTIPDGGGEGGQGANGKGLHTAASGDPTLAIDGNGVAHLTSSKFGRIYIYANNYNARLEGNLMFEKINNPEDNISFKLRSRHGHNSKYPLGGGSACGGVGAAYKGHGGIELQVEGDHDTDGSTDMGAGKGSVPQVGKWSSSHFQYGMLVGL